MPNKTEHIQLNQWEPEDAFLRTDFNEDNARLDSAISTLQTELTGYTRVVFGQYVGKQTAATATAQEITLGFQPKAVLTVGHGKGDPAYCYSDLKYFGSNSPGSISFTETGFTVCNSGYSIINLANRTYTYVAFY